MIEARRTHTRWSVAQTTVAVLLSIAASSVTAAAQQAPALGGFTRDNGPINIQADSLNINNQKKIATYKGNVVAVQGSNTLRTVELEVHYVSKDEDQPTPKGGAAKTGRASKPAAQPAGALGEEGQQIKRIMAKQKVVMVSTPAGKEAQSATSDTADYDVTGQQVELRGNVFIKQGDNVVCGSKVRMNLQTSEFSVLRDATAPAPTNPECGRVRGIFMPPKKTAEGAAKPTTAPASAPASPTAGTGAAKSAVDPGKAAPSSSSWSATTSTQR